MCSRITQPLLRPPFARGIEFRAQHTDEQFRPVAGGRFAGAFITFDAP
jgi:hypothetical protein